MLQAVRVADEERGIRLGHHRGRSGLVDKEGAMPK